LFLDTRFFWAINDQSDSTIGIDYLSKRGIRPSLEYRYALSAIDHGQFNGVFLDDTLTGHQFWKVTGTAQQALPGQLQAILALDLLSRENYDRTFEVENVLFRTRREATSFLALIRNWENAAVELRLQREKDVDARGDEKLARYPGADFSLLPTRLPWAPLAVRLDADATNFRFERAATRGTDLDTRRVNLQPQLAWTHAYSPWLAVTPFFSFQETLLDQKEQSAEAQGVVMLGAELGGPKLFKVYGSEEGGRYKHLLQPSVIYHWVPSFRERTRRQPFDIRDDVFPRNDLALSLTNRFFARTQATGEPSEVRELGLLRISQGLDLRGERGAEFSRLAPGPFFADLLVEARAQLTSTLRLNADAAYDYAQGDLDLANAGLTLQPFRFLTLSLDRRFRKAPDIDFVNGAVGLSLPKGWSLSYSTGYNVRDRAFAGNSAAALYQAQCWNLRLDMHQRPEETRFTVQIGLEAFQGPKLGF
jgi:lipopolysaccharide assembly outer membrane protein LptD (OstA)